MPANLKLSLRRAVKQGRYVTLRREVKEVLYLYKSDAKSSSRRPGKWSRLVETGTYQLTALKPERDTQIPSKQDARNDEMQILIGGE